MASRPLKREFSQGYPIPSRQPLPWRAQGNDDDDDDNSYDQRRYSVTGNGFATSPPYGSRPPVAASAYDSYEYPASSTPHAPYTPHYAYGNQSYATSYSQPHTTNETRSPTTYRSHYSNAEYPTDYSSNHATTPAIAYSHARIPSLTTPIDYLTDSHHRHDIYANSNNHSTAEYITTTNDLIRTPSQRSDGNRSQTSNDGKDRRFICNRYANDESQCSSAFVRKSDLTRHIDCVHDKKPQFSCPVRNCSRKGVQGFTRRDHRTEHLRNFHHRDIPKRPRGDQQMDEEDDEDIPPF
ncbi:hypothetical protein EG328_006388 [Venturia inaequalis]|uniref:C2H2-type domain-containing protein n=2 Tax=Venturia inaequalis TaxID=5025 RepID=A0A8H3UIZ6_VENIN|nr:hypothetical protein EG328_006388 [Venturia inaequalis]